MRLGNSDEEVSGMGKNSKAKEELVKGTEDRESDQV